MLTSWFKRIVAVALVASPVYAFGADDAAALKNAPMTVSVNAGQGGFVTVPIVRNEIRTYALSGVKAPEVRVMNYRFGQGDVSVRFGN